MNKGKPYKKVRAQYVPPYDKELLARPVSDLDLSDALKEILTNGYIKDLYGIVRRSEREMFGVKFFNKKHLTELKHALSALSVDFREEVREEENAEAIDGADEKSDAQKTEAVSANVKPFDPKAGRRPDRNDNRGDRNDNRRDRNDNRGDRNGASVDRRQDAVAAGAERGRAQSVGENADRRPNAERNTGFGNGKPKIDQNRKQLGDPAKNRQKDGGSGDRREQPNSGNREKSGKKSIYGYATDLIKFFQEKIPQGERPKAADEPTKNTPISPEENWTKYTRNGRYGYIEPGTNQIKIQPVYEEIFAFREGLACAEKNELFGYVDPQNNVIIPFDYELGMSFKEGLACVTKHGKSGFIDREGNVAIPFRFDAAMPFNDGVARVKESEKWEEIDKSGKVVKIY
ncbi:MAG: WG repeat-containing protein [Clostridiales bacterium]|jgi:hypothetical protein|nr:WG repeat-containing protein [Clostridiales bacterium]